MCKDKITEEGIFLPGLHGHCHQVDDLARFRTKQRTSHYLVRIGVHHHLEQSVRIAQSPGTQIVPDNQWAVTLLTNAVTWICASATVVTEWMSIKGTLSRQNRWFVSLLSLATIVHVTYLMMAVICEKDTIVSIPLASTVLLFSAGLWFGWRQRNLFYLSAIPFAILMILLSLFICHSNLRDVNIFLLSGIIVITGTTLLIYAILHLKKQWYGTEE